MQFTEENALQRMMKQLI